MGAADIIPGVSGGTMALITGIYQPLLNSIRSVDALTIGSLVRLRFKEAFSRIDVAFLATLVTGIAAAILFFTKVVPLPKYMVSHPELVYGLFFGLIVGSIVLLFMDIDPARRKPLQLLFIVVGAAIGFKVVTLVPSETPESWWFIFLSGAVAICAMILPGISGSFILLILRKYDFILYQIGSLGGPYTLEALMVLVPFGFGALAGLALFSRFLSWLLERAEISTMMVLIGFLIGSLWVIWPWQERSFVESIRSTEVLAVSDPIAQELLTASPDPYALRFRRIAESAESSNPIEIVTPLEASRTDSIVIEEVSRKMTAERPLLPWSAEFKESATTSSNPIMEGILGMGVGLLLTLLIFGLRKRA